MFKKIAPDKWRHIYAGIVMGAVLQGIAAWLFPHQLMMATILVFIIVIAISYGFELFSKFTGIGVYDVMDAVASAIGGAIGMGLIELVLFFIK